MIRLFITALLIMCAVPVWSADIIRTHALTLIDEPKYGPGFKHFDYVNPDAPKGGTFRRAIPGTFDSLNQFAPKGMPIRPFIMGYMYDTLMTSSEDQLSTYYGLIAESVEYPTDYSWVIFHLRKNARWHDGKPITADDVVFSFNKLKEVSPSYKNYYNLIEKAVAVDPYTVKFEFNKDETSRELPMIAGQLTVLPKHYWQSRDLSKSTLEIPLCSGPYKITSLEQGRQVTLELVDNYWGKDLPVNKGQNNFRKLTFEFFRDQTVLFEAFKAGQFDFMADGSGIRWNRGYTGKYFDMGLIKREEVPNKIGTGMSGILMNTSIKPLDNILVRQALAYVYDFEWINRNLYFDQQVRHDSYFSNSELACGAVPSPEVQAVLRAVKPDADKALLTEPYRLPSTDGTGNNRDNLMKAVKLFEQAGYKLSKNKMIGPDGKQLRIEITTASKTVENELLTFQKSLGRIGIDFFIRYLDSPQYVDKVRNKEYMMLYSGTHGTVSPGNEQRSLWHSAAADEVGSGNNARVKDPAVDKLVEMIIAAPDRKSLVIYTKALDRLLLSGWYYIPTGYSNKYRIAYWDKFVKPDVSPAYTIGFSSWWIDIEKEKKINAIVNK